MPRTHDDSWDLASSVGATATMVAAARAQASRADNALIDDPFAQPLVEAVGIELFARLASGQLSPTDLDDDPAHGARMADAMAARTKFFDDFFADAAAAGIRQAVILASGLDARAYRLTWPAGTVVYELDQPRVIEFKTKTLTEIGAQPTTERRTVAIDLRFDWPAALRGAGFDPDQPTAWIAEGLLGYLPPEGQDRLLDNITALSVEGSRFATESIPHTADVDRDEVRKRMQTVSERWRDHGYELDMTELVYFEDRNEVAAYLNDRGWQVVGRTTDELFADYGLDPLERPLPFGDITYVSAILKPS